MISLKNSPMRLRRKAYIRDLVRENEITMNDIMYPIFLAEGENIRCEISSMKDQFHVSVDKLEKEIELLKQKGIKALLVFGEPKNKDELGACAFSDDGIIQKGIRKIKSVAPEMFVASDACLCPFKTDGHCGYFDEDGEIELKKTLDALCEIAISHAKAGSDMIAPSDMMDSRIGAIRGALDDTGFSHIGIMSYSAKFASNYYGPFRDAVDSAPRFGDRKAYQMDFCNKREAMKEMELDVLQGADIVMVKPAGAYLDIIDNAKQRFDLPIAAYQVSGEYAMLYNGVKQGVVGKAAIYESLMAIKRSGADIIITYFAKEIEELIGEING